MEYEVVAEAYRDLEQATGRLMLIDRLATLIRETPQELLPTICYLCQGQVAPEFAGVDLGLAEKMALRAVATATDLAPEQVLAAVRDTGDLGQAAEQLLAATASDREPSLQVAAVVDTLHEIARTEGTGSQGRKLELLAGLLALATPLEARYLLRLVTGNLRLGIGTPTILDALAQVYTGSRKDRPVLERAYNICCDLGLVAATLAAGGLTAVKEMQVRAGNPVRVMLAQRLSEAGEILARLGGQCMAEYKYDGMRLQAHRTADGQIELFTRRQERVSTQFPDVVELLQTGLGPREAILEGEVVAYDAAAGELRPFQEVMFRRRKHGIAEAARDVPVGLFCFELLYADGEDLTELPYLDRRARLAEALTLSDRLRLTTALEVATAPVLDAAFEQAVADGSEGLVCKSTGSNADLSGRRPRLAVDQAEAGLPHRARRHCRSRCGRRVRRTRSTPRNLRRGAVGRLQPRRGALPDGGPMRHRVFRRRTGRIAGEAGTVHSSGAARACRFSGARRRVVRTRRGARGSQRRAHAVAEPHRWLGSAQG